MLALKRIAGVVLNTSLWALLLFLPAGTIHWPRAWILLGVNFLAAAIVISAVSRELLDERFKGPLQKGQPLTDKILVVAFAATFFGTVLLIPLDVFRLHLLGSPGRVVSWAGLLLFAAGWCIAGSAVIENSYAARVVRLQSERHQNVIQSGPYRVVRHPLYSGLILLPIGMALWLGSYAAALAAVVPIILIAIRAVLEERFLRRELPGYDEYMKRTRYRLVPFVW